MRAREAGVSQTLCIASELDDARQVARLVADRPTLFGTAGVHPHDAAHAPSDLREPLVEALGSHPRIVAIGECGLDFHYDFSPRDVQRRVFDLQLGVAGELGLPVVVHCREAEAEMIPIVREAGVAGIRGVLHCFPGDLELLATAMEAGWMVSFTGNVTFRNFTGMDAVKTVPADRYMLETDGPWMAPVPHRGSRNEPALIPLIRNRIAELRGETPEAVEAATDRNARRFFSLPEPG